MKKRFLAFLLAITLVASCLPVGVWAEGEAVSVGDAAALKAAVAAGGNIQLTASFDLTEKITVAADKTVVLDLNGHEISSDKGINAYIGNAGNLTIKDSVGGGKIFVSCPSTDTTTFYSVYNDGNLTLESGEIVVSANGGGNAYGIYSNSGNLTITGGTVKAQRGATATTKLTYALGLGGNGTVKISNATIEATSENTNKDTRTALIYLLKNGVPTITIESGTFAATGVNAHGASIVRNNGSTNKNAKLNIQGGNFMDVVAGDEGLINVVGTVTITGGSFPADVTKYLSAGYVQAANGDVALEVASSDALVEAMQKNGAIRLTGDFALDAKATVPAGVTVTLDLNGKTITSSDCNVSTGTYLVNNGTLTILDSVGTGGFTGETKASANAYGIHNTGNLTIDGGSFTVNSTSRTVYTLYSEGPSVTINGGTFTANYNASGAYSSHALALAGSASAEESVVTITGGTFVAYSESNANARCAPIFARGTAKLHITVEDGTFTATRTASAYGASAVRYGDSSTTDTVTIKGGTFSATAGSSGMFTGSKGTLNISGGTFTYDGTIINRSGAVTGGTFVKQDGTKNDISKYVSAGYEQAENGEVVVEGVVPAHSHKLCGDNACTEHSEVEFQPWEDTTSLPASGNYYLTADVQLNAVHVVKNDLTICLNGKTITAPANDRSFALNAGYTLTITDHDNTGKITGGVRNWGGVINVNAGATFNLYGGSLTGNKNKTTTTGDGQGGAVYLSAASGDVTGGVFNMYGGTITGNEAYKGGAVYMSKGSAFNLYGGTISGNTATNSGGAILVGTNATFNMAGGEISNNNSATEGGAITVTNSPVILSGNAVIKDNLANGVISNLYLKTGVITVKEMNTAAQIGIGVANPANGLAISEKLNGIKVDGIFTSDNEEYEIAVENDQLCLKEKVYHKHDLDNCEEHDDDVNFLPWDSTTSLPTSGNYYLTANVQLKAVHAPKGDLNLCLNGCTITAPANERTFALSKGYTLSITDHEGAGKITGGVRNWGGVINVNAGATFNLYGGSLTGNKNKTTTTGDGQGGAVYLSAASGDVTGGVFNMYGGSITDNEAYKGGAIYMSKGSVVNLYGGTISGNTAKNSGGAILVGTNATLNIAGGTITDNTSAIEGGAITVVNSKIILSGSPVITGNKADGKFSNLYLPADGVITVGQLSQGAQVGVTSQKPVDNLVITEKLNGADVVGYFASDDVNYTIGLKDDVLQLQVKSTHIHNLCCDSTCTDHGDVKFLPWDDATKLPAYGNYCLMVDVQLNAVHVVKNDLTICLNGHTITAPKNERTFALNKDMTLNVTDCTGKGKITGGVRNYGGVINVNEGATFNLYAGSLTGNQVVDLENANTGRGGAVFLTKSQNDRAGGVFNMYGGKITENKANRGGAVFLNEGATFNMYGGELSKNSATTRGGAINNEGKATINIYGGKITENTAKNGAAISLYHATLATISGGEISKNTSTGAGGAIILESKNTKLVITDGKIANNTGSSGGAIYASRNTILDISGGEFAGNAATKNGGAIYLLEAKATISNSTFSNSKSATRGGAILSDSSSTLELKNTTITGGTAKNGAAMSLTYATVVNMTDCVVTKNTSTGAGGAILMENTGTKLNLVNTEISGNSGSTGGAIYVSRRCTLEVSGGKIANNTAKKYGGGLYLLQGTATIRSGSICNNKTLEKGGQGGGIKVDGGTLNIYGGSIYGNYLHEKGSGGAAIAAYKTTETKNGVTYTYYTTINMYGGTISNHVARNGAAMQITGQSTFNMYGGTFRNNEAVVDGGVAAMYSKGVFNMYGGQMIGNKSTATGGALYYATGTNGTITGGTATDNYAKGKGGFLHAYGKDTVITMKNFKAYGNESADYGGAVAMSMQSTLHMDDCELYDNNAKKGGALLTAHKTTAYVNNVKIYRNTAVETGGAVYVDVGNNINFTNVKILDNTSGKNGGAILTRGNLHLKDCLIDGNTSGENGGGIATSSAWTYDHTITNGYVGRGQGTIIENTVISNNTCALKGGGVFMKEKNWNTVIDSTFTGNISGEGGSALFVKDDLKIVGMTVTGNNSENGGYAVWFDTNEYDGNSYSHGLFEMGGNVIVKDNQGGDMMLCENVVLSNVVEGYGEDTHFNVTLDSGVLTNRVLGAYNYEGGDLNYTVTYGTRSYDEPEYEAPKAEAPAETQKIANSDNTLLYIGVGAFALAVIAAVILIVKKKKKTPAAEKE